MNKSALTQMDHLSVLVIRALACLQVVPTVLVRMLHTLYIELITILLLNFQISMSVKLTTEAVNKTVPTRMGHSSALAIRVIDCLLMV